MHMAVQGTSKKVEALALLALIGLIYAAWESWDPIEKIYNQSHNTLGQINGQVPTSELFFWSTAALILYFLTRIWAYLAQPVFALTDERAGLWRQRLQWLRLAMMMGLLGATLMTIHRSGYNLW